MDCQKILHRRNGPQGPDSGPDVVSRRELGKRKAYRSLDGRPQGLMDEGRTVIGRARRHLICLPKDVADDGRFSIADIEAVDADAGSGKVAIQANTRDGLDGGYENPGQCFLMSSRSGDATIQELLYPGVEADNARYVGRTRFKDTGDSRRLLPLEGMDAVAAGDVRRHSSIAADDDAARPAWPVKRFMARKAGCRDDAIG